MTPHANIELTYDERASKDYEARMKQTLSEPPKPWTPNQAWADKRGLTLDEAEIWVELYHRDSTLEDATKALRFRKDTGLIEVVFYDGNSGVDSYERLVFSGFIPSEEALENILTWTRWNA